MTTPAKEMGIKQGDVVRMTNTETSLFAKGVLIRLKRDDASAVPLFELVSDVDTTRYVQLDNVEVIADMAASTPARSLAQTLSISLAGSFREVIGSFAKPANLNLVTETDQSRALATFNAMLTRAKAYRNGETVSDSLFYTGYGICDNIHRCTPERGNSDLMALIKDNIIRRLPSYSGNYHYPVMSPAAHTTDAERRSFAEDAWSNNNNKWAGPYGANRLAQLEELIYHIEHKWDDSLAKDMTPAQRVGLIEGVTLVQHRDGTLWKFVSDDKSSDPYFESVTDGGRRSLDLRYITAVSMEDFTNDQRSVAEFLEQIKATQARQAEIQASIAALQRELTDASQHLTMLDYGLGVVHKVQRMDK